MNFTFMLEKYNDWLSRYESFTARKITYTIIFYLYRSKCQRSITYYLDYLLVAFCLHSFVDAYQQKDVFLHNALFVILLFRKSATFVVI